MNCTVSNLPPYSPDLSPLDAAAFGNFARTLRESLADKKTKTPSSMKQFDALATSLMTTRHGAVVKATTKFIDHYKARLRACVAAGGELVK